MTYGYIWHHVWRKRKEGFECWILFKLMYILYIYNIDIYLFIYGSGRSWTCFCPTIHRSTSSPRRSFSSLNPWIYLTGRYSWIGSRFFSGSKKGLEGAMQWPGKSGKFDGDVCRNHESYVFFMMFLFFLCGCFFPKCQSEAICGVNKFADWHFAAVDVPDGVHPAAFAKAGTDKPGKLDVGPHGSESLMLRLDAKGNTACQNWDDFE